MLALTKLTEPGPFLPRTIELGAYSGSTMPDLWWPWQESGFTSPGSPKSAQCVRIPNTGDEDMETRYCPP